MKAKSLLSLDLAGKDLLLCGLSEVGRLSPDGLLDLLLKESRSLTVLERADAAVGIARDKGCRTIQADAESFGADSRFDLALCLKLLNHLRTPGSFLDRVRDFLKPDGMIYIQTPNATAMQLTVVKILGRLHSSDYANPLHLAIYDRASLTDLLSQHGFEVVELKYEATSRVGRLASMIRPSWADDIRVLACSEEAIP